VRWRSGPGRLIALMAVAACGGEEPRPEPGASGTVSAAAASNFTATLDSLAALFLDLTGVQVIATSGSSGQLYAQILNGAPFHVFLSADSARPLLLEAEGLTVPDTRFTYALGQLVLYGPGLDTVRADGADLRGPLDGRLAVANPETAPYGVAALEVLEHLGRGELEPTLVRGESVAQVLSFVRSGAAELGFVALSQVVDEPPSTYWSVPPELYAPIRQDAVLLESGGSHAGARAFLEFLQGPEAGALIVRHGYGVTAAGGR